MNASSGSSQHALPHIEALYALAQVLTLDADKAAHLVEQTYRRAMAMAGERPVLLEDRRQMMQLLVRVHQEASTAAGLFAPATTGTPSQAQESFKQRLLEGFLRKTVPVAFATLDAHARALLAFCEVDQMSCTDAGRILDTPPETACRQLEEARSAFERTVRANASPAEAQLLDEVIRSGWIGQALRKALSTDFAAAPPTLEARLRSVLEKSPAVSPPPATSAPARSSSPPSTNKRFSRGLTTLLLILTAGMAGYIGSALFSPIPEHDLITLSVEKAPRVETILQTSNLDEAERFVRHQLQWRLTVPEISEAHLTGVGISEVAQNVRVPVFLYTDESEQHEGPITVYAYTYALLDRFADRIRLNRDILTNISRDNQFDIHDLDDERNVIIWRDANDIFLAVVRGDARALRKRIGLR